MTYHVILSAVDFLQGVLKDSFSIFFFDCCLHFCDYSQSCSKSCYIAYSFAVDFFESMPLVLLFAQSLSVL